MMETKWTRSDECHAIKYPFIFLLLTFFVSDINIIILQTREMGTALLIRCTIVNVLKWHLKIVCILLGHFIGVEGGMWWTRQVCYKSCDECVTSRVSSMFAVRTGQTQRRTAAGLQIRFRTTTIVLWPKRFVVENKVWGQKTLIWRKQYRDMFNVLKYMCNPLEP
jgi:hypothetical protein